MDRELCKLNQQKRRLHRKWLADRTNLAAHAAFRRVRSNAANANRRKQNQYFFNQCEENSRNPGKMWSVLNAVTGRKTQHREPTCDIGQVSDAFCRVVTDEASPSNMAMPEDPQLQKFPVCLQSCYRI
eukprot:scpid30618/ scgid27134/ 